MKKMTSALSSATKELAYQDEEKGKRAAELLIANKELVFQNREKEKRAAELVIANKELLYQNGEKEKRAVELFLTNQELVKTQDDLQEYIFGLKEMMFVTSHKVRQPVANILGICTQISQPLTSHEELVQWVGCIRESALRLDIFTKELTVLITKLDQKGRENIE